MMLTLLADGCVYRALDLPENVQDYPEEGTTHASQFLSEDVVER